MKEWARRSQPLHVVPEEKTDEDNAVESTTVDGQVVSLTNKLISRGYAPKRIHPIALTETTPEVIRRIAKDITAHDSLLVYCAAYSDDLHEKDTHVPTFLQGERLLTGLDFLQSTYQRDQWEEIVGVLDEVRAKHQFIIIDAMQSATLSMLKTPSTTRQMDVVPRSNEQLSEYFSQKWQTIHVFVTNSESFSQRCVHLIEDTINKYLSVKEDLPARDCTTIQDRGATKPCLRSLKLLEAITTSYEGATISRNTIPYMKPHVRSKIFLSYALKEKHERLQVLSSLRDQHVETTVGTTFSQLSLLTISRVPHSKDGRGYKHMSGLVANAHDSLRDSRVSLAALVIVGSQNVVIRPTVADEIALAQTYTDQQPAFSEQFDRNAKETLSRRLSYEMPMKIREKALIDLVDIGNTYVIKYIEYCSIPLQDREDLLSVIWMQVIDCIREGTYQPTPNADPVPWLLGKARTLVARERQRIHIRRFENIVTSALEEESDVPDDFASSPLNRSDIYHFQRLANLLSTDEDRKVLEVLGNGATITDLANTMEVPYKTAWRRYHKVVDVVRKILIHGVLPTDILARR